MACRAGMTARTEIEDDEEEGGCDICGGASSSPTICV